MQSVGNLKMRLKMKKDKILFLSILFFSQSCAVQCCFAQQTKPLQHFWEVSPDFGDIWKVELPERVIHFNVESLISTQEQERIEVARMICREYKNSNFKAKARALELIERVLA